MLTNNQTSVLSREAAPADGLDLRLLLARLLAHRWLILACVVLATAGFSAVAFLTRPVYRVTAVLASAASDRGDGVVNLAASSLGGLASGLGLGATRDAETEEALAVLSSRELTERFITDKNLTPKLFPRKWDATKGTWKVDAEHQPTLAQAYKYFNEKVRAVTEDRKTGLITLQMDWTDRQEAADWSVELIHRLNEEMRSRAVSKADAALQFLEQELRATSEFEIRNSLARLMEAQIKQRMLAHVTQDYSLRFVDRPIATDREKPIRPQKLLLLALGPIAGLAVGIALVVLFTPRRRQEF